MEFRIGDNKTKLSKFQIRLVDLKNIQKSEQEFSELLNDTINKHCRPDYGFKLSLSDINEYSNAKNSMEITPWYKEFCGQYMMNIGVSNHEYFNHPVACVVVMSSQEQDLNLTAKKMYKR